MKLPPVLLCGAFFACGGSNAGPGEPAHNGGTIDFTPTSVEVLRLATAACSRGPLPFSDGDLFTMAIQGRGGVGSELEISFSSPVMAGVPLMLTAQPVMPHGTSTVLSDGGISWAPLQKAQEGGVELDYLHGSDVEIDSGAFDAVTVTILTIPAKDGDPLTLRARVHFVDGRVLDESFTGPLSSNCFARAG